MSAPSFCKKPDVGTCYSAVSDITDDGDLAPLNGFARLLHAKKVKQGLGGVSVPAVTGIQHMYFILEQFRQFVRAAGGAVALNNSIYAHRNECSRSVFDSLAFGDRRHANVQIEDRGA